MSRLRVSGAQPSQHRHVALVNARGVREDSDGARDARLAQKVEHGVRRAVRVVGGVIGGRLGKAVIGMEAGDLQLSFQLELAQLVIRVAQKVVVVEEVTQSGGWISSVVSMSSGSALVKAVSSSSSAAKSSFSFSACVTR